MARNVIFFAWNRSIPGREQISGAHFDEFVAYLGSQAQSGTIQGFDVVLLDNHGGRPERVLPHPWRLGKHWIL